VKALRPRTGLSQHGPSRRWKEPSGSKVWEDHEESASARIEALGCAIKPPTADPLVVPSGRSISFRSPLARRDRIWRRHRRSRFAWRAVRRSLIQGLDSPALNPGRLQRPDQAQGWPPCSANNTAEVPCSQLPAPVQISVSSIALVLPPPACGARASQRAGQIEQHRQGPLRWLKVVDHGRNEGSATGSTGHHLLPWQLLLATAPCSATDSHPRPASACKPGFPGPAQEPCWRPCQARRRRRASASVVKSRGLR